MYSGWVFVDVDGTLIDADDNPRPFIRELFQGIKDQNLLLVIWSGGGKEYAEGQVQKLGTEIYSFVDEFRWKGTPVVWTHIAPVFFIDDSMFIYKEHNVDGQRAFWVPFYNSSIARENDQWLLKALEASKEFYKLYNKGGHKLMISTNLLLSKPQ